MSTEIEAAETVWPDVIKCRYHDVYYNVTKHSEKLELLALRYGERYVGAETDTSVNIYSGGLQSPNSASKRKALRLKAIKVKWKKLQHYIWKRFKPKLPSELPPADEKSSPLSGIKSYILTESGK